MVSFNVLQMDGGRFHRGTSGPLVIEAGAPPLVAPHLDILAHADMRAVLAGKLVYNLNNALERVVRADPAPAARRPPLAPAFSPPRRTKRWRCSRAEGIQPWSLGKVPVTRFPLILRLPDFLFRLLSRRGVRIDASARSSMWEDLERRRPTEIAELQGAVIARAAALGLAAPVNRRIAEAIRAAEAAAAGSPRLDPAALLRATFLTPSQPRRSTSGSFRSVTERCTKPPTATSA